MRYANALDEARGVSLDEIGRYMKLDIRKVEETVRGLYEEGMVHVEGERVWLSRKGFLSALKGYS